MKFTDMFFSLLIILIFVLLFTFTFLSVGLKNIRKKWPIYRCNPMMMPFASKLGPTGTDDMANFTYCVQGITKGVMGDLLQPVHYVTSLAQNIGGDITNAIQDIRKVFNYVKNMIISIIEKVFGALVNILVAMLHIIIQVKDLGSKIMGVMASMLYIIEGMVKTGGSIWAGPLGDVVRFLCFHPKTPIRLKSGTTKELKNIHIGDILMNGSEVLGTLQLKGSKKNPYYKIYSEAENKNIYVTGSHLIQHPITQKFISVSDFEGAELTNIYSDKMCCLITDDHLIPVGEFTFWDWED